MKVEELLRCQIHVWYPKFKPHTIRTLFHPLPEEFLRYIVGDTSGSDAVAAPFLLPCPAGAVGDPFPRLPAHLTDPVSSFDSSDDDDETTSPDPPSFPDLEVAVSRSIAALGGAVIPKLNWSAPKDAAWITTGGTLSCTSFSDIALLLRSSDAAAHDISLALPACSDHDPSASPCSFHLALRRWQPSWSSDMEFRCFVRRRRLIAVSQRDTTAFYPSLIQRRHKILPLIRRFFIDIIRPGFESPDYTFDVYATASGRIKVVDFNPWGAFTLPLLFDWEELEGEGFDLKLRIVENQCGVRPGLRTAVPFDYLDTGEGSGWDVFLKKAEQELKSQKL